MTEAHPHEDGELCEPRLKPYRQALMDGRPRAEDAALAPARSASASSSPRSRTSTGWNPAPPVSYSTACSGLRASGDRIAKERRRRAARAARNSATSSGSPGFLTGRAGNPDHGRPGGLGRRR